jgi:hypothetical protein
LGLKDIQITTTHKDVVMVESSMSIPSHHSSDKDIREMYIVETFQRLGLQLKNHCDFKIEYGLSSGIAISPSYDNAVIKAKVYIVK